MRSGAPVQIKLVLLGDGRVGKTSLTLRYVNNVFSEKQTATIQASYLTKRLTVDGQAVNLCIWDTAGQERFHALGPIYYRDADAALLVYDLLDKDSFDRVQSWVRELKKMASKNIVLAIAGNKSDMDKLRQVNMQESEAYAESIGATHFVTSAKLNAGIEEAFIDIARRVLQQRAVEGTGSPAGGGRRKSVIIVDKQTPATTAQASRCCS
jgi:Ras-related protein Rab-21